MNFVRSVFGFKPKDETETPVPSVTTLTEDEVYDTVKDFLTKGLPNPSNKQIADKLGRTIEEVNVVRPRGPKLHSYYDDDDNKLGANEAPSSIHYDSEERREILAPLIGKSTLTQGGRKNHKTVSNKNKKKHKKNTTLRRRYKNKNRKSIKRK
jgi:hypothetical protein